MSQWHVYIIRATDHSLYAGITTDVERRFADTRRCCWCQVLSRTQPEKIVLVESGYDRSGASIREAQIKKLSRQQKLALIEKYQNL